MVDRPHALTAAGLEGWLLDAGLADKRNGRLYATPRGLDVAAGLG